MVALGLHHTSPEASLLVTIEKHVPQLAAWENAFCDQLVSNCRGRGVQYWTENLRVITLAVSRLLWSPETTICLQTAKLLTKC